MADRLIDEEIDGTEIAIEFQPLDDKAAGSVRSAFADDQILETHAFSGADILIVLLKISKGTIERLLQLVAQNKYRHCKIKVSGKEIVIVGYGINDAQTLLQSAEAVKARIRDSRDD